MIKSSIGYYGCATIKLLKGKRVVRTILHHNNGTEWLFRLLASTLCGKDETSNMPKFLDLLHLENQSDPNSALVSSLAGRVSLTAKVLENVSVAESTNSAKVAASFTAFVPASMVTNDDINALAIYSDATGDTMLAEIKLDELVDLTTKRSYNLMIDWTMTFNNVVTSTQGDSD